MVVNAAMRLKEVLDDVKVLAKHSVEVGLVGVVDADANAREELPSCRIKVKVHEDGLRWVLLLQLVPGSTLRVEIAGLVQIALIIIALLLEHWVVYSRTLAQAACFKTDVAFLFREVQVIVT